MTREEAIKHFENLLNMLAPHYVPPVVYGEECRTSDKFTGNSNQLVDLCVLALAALREPERERGEWVLVYRDSTTKLEWHECSICKRMMHYYPWSERDNFCPCCGNDMRPEGGADRE